MNDKKGTIGLVLLAGAAISFYLYSFFQSPPPRNAEITNLSDRSATFIFKTEAPAETSVLTCDAAWKMSLPFLNRLICQTAFAETLRNGLIHSVTVRGLQPGKTYFCRIGSGIRLFGSRSTVDGGSWNLRTKSTILAAPTNMVGGTILKRSGQKAAGAVVILRFLPGETLSAVTDENGRWQMDLAAEPDWQASAILLVVEGGGMGSTVVPITDKGQLQGTVTLK